MITVIALIIGILVFGAGMYYLIREKQDQESKKIYTVTCLAGAAIAIISAVLLLV